MNLISFLSWMAIVSRVSGTWGGSSLHFPVSWEMERSPTYLEITVGNRRVHIDGETCLYHRGSVNASTNQLFVRVPNGVEAGVQRIMVSDGKLLLDEMVLIKPAITRVVYGNGFVHLDGSGFSLTDTTLTVGNTVCKIATLDYHQLDADCGQYVPQFKIQKILRSGLQLEIGESVAVLKTEVKWPVKSEVSIKNEAVSKNTWFMAPQTGHYNFHIRCPNRPLCGEFAMRETTLIAGQLYAINLTLSGEEFELGVTIETAGMGSTRLDKVPSAWFRHETTAKVLPKIHLVVNEIEAVHEYYEQVLLDTSPMMLPQPVERRLSSDKRRNLQGSFPSDRRRFQEWQQSTGCSDCIIPAGTKLVIDVDVTVRSLTIRGDLLWDTSLLSSASTIETGFFVVESGGVFLLDASSGVDATLYVKRNGAAHSDLGEQTVGSYHARGSALTPPVFHIKGRPMQRTWSLTSEEHRDGMNQITMEHDAAEMGWRVGDRIVIANTDMPTVTQGSFKGPQELRIVSIADNKITVSPNLNQLYFGSKTRKLQAEVINLSRNVEITGDDFRFLKGLHIIGAGGGVFDISYSRVSKCGRRGEKARYCLHFHHMNECPSCSFVGNSIEDSNQRGIVVHATHRSITKDNVLFKVKGAGIYVEDGNEMNNLIQDNVVVCHSSFRDRTACRAPGTINDNADDIQQSGIWALAVTNDFIGNRVVNHYNGFFTQVSLFPFGQGAAAGKVCTVHAPFGIFRGNVAHSCMKFGFYLDNNWPRNIKRDSNGFVTDKNSCEEFNADGSDNGLKGVVEDGVDFGSTFVGQYEMGDVQYLRHTSVNNLHNMYWKATKNFQDGFSSHIKDSTFGWYSLPGYPGAGVGHILGPGGLGAFIIEGSKFFGNMVEGGINANHHCTVAGTGGLCTPEYLLVDTKLTDLPSSMRWIRFGISDGNKELPIFTSFDGSLPSGSSSAPLVSVASSYMSYLLDIKVNENTVCKRASDVGLDKKFNDGILCEAPLRRLQLWTERNLGDIRIYNAEGSFYTMKYIEPCPGTSPSCVNKKGYGAVVIPGQKYTIDLDPSVKVVWEFSDAIFGSRFNSLDSVELVFRDGKSCLMKSDHDRRFIGPHGPITGVNSPLGTCLEKIHRNPSSNPTKKPTGNPTTPGTNKPTIGGYELVWSDEFEGSTIDTSKWGYDILPPYKYNNELQSYTNSAENSFVENGMLHIRAVKQGNGYTSARMVTKGKGDWLYGKIIVRAKLPVGQGLWPAIWALPTSSYGWPKGGEIDIMEHVSCDVNQVHGTVHTGAYNWPMGTQKGAKTTATVSDFHDYMLEWDEDQLTVSLDNTPYFTFKNDGTGDVNTWPFYTKFHLILNIAVGGDWGGYCLNGAKPSFPDDEANSHMVVDYVRVYSSPTAGTAAPTSTDDGSCSGPFPGYPDCEARMEWMLQNWDGQYKQAYVNAGIDGSKCSIQKYLRAEGMYCPEVIVSTQKPTTGSVTASPSKQPILESTKEPTLDPTKEPTLEPTREPTKQLTKQPTREPTKQPTSKNPDGACEGPYSDEYPTCMARMDWMVANWNTVSWTQIYKDAGVNGSRCSIQRYLRAEGMYCPRSSDTCEGPFGAYPECENRIIWMVANWNSVSWTKAYKDAGVDGSRCSIQEFIHREGYCPMP